MLRSWQLSLVLVLAMAAVRAHGAQVQLTTLSYGKAVVLDLSAQTTYRFFTLKNPSRLVVDLTNTQAPSSLATPPANHPLLVNARAGVRNNHDLRLVFELNAEVVAQSSLVAQGGGARLQFDLSQSSKSVAVKPEAKPEPVSAPASAKIEAANDNRKVNVKPAALLVAKVDSKAVKPLKAVAVKTRDIVIAVDAGHGGKDVGAQGGNGTQEKDVVFAIAKRLAARIDAQPGMKAVMIRNGDYFVKLRERVNIARAAKADLFVSIHADAFDDTSAHGASVYTLSNKGASSAAARFLADSENASDLVGGVSLEDKDDTLASVLVDLSQSAAKEASQNVGNRVLHSVQSVGHLHRQQVQKADFVVLKSPDIPSILVETAFISNPNEEQRLNSKAYQDQMASAVFGGIVAHFRQYAPANTLFAQRSKSGKAASRQLAAVAPEPELQSTDKSQLLASGDADEEQTSRPAKLASNQHVINAGETLSEIAQRHGVSMRELRLANGMNDGNVKVGQVLQIPQRSVRANQT